MQVTPYPAHGAYVPPAPPSPVASPVVGDAQGSPESSQKVDGKAVPAVTEGERAYASDQRRGSATVQEDGEAPEERQTEDAKGQEAEASKEREELRMIRDMQHRDREVRAHEAAHASVGGHLTGTPTYSYERGPDGVNYAVAGQVSVKSPIVPGDPQKTLQQAEQIRRAALAPAEPSPADRQVAAQAMKIAAEARAELARDAQDTGATDEGSVASGDEAARPPDDEKSRSDPASARGVAAYRDMQGGAAQELAARVVLEA